MCSLQDMPIVGQSEEAKRSSTPVWVRHDIPAWRGRMVVTHLCSLGSEASVAAGCVQGFVRSTTKYWVRTADVSAVKHHILQHLPVFTFDSSVRTPPVPRQLLADALALTDCPKIAGFALRKPT